MNGAASSIGSIWTFGVFGMLLPLLGGWNLLESPNRSVEAGNTQLRAGKAEEALASYDKAARGLAADPGVRFDRGAALFALSRYEEAIGEFLRATEAKGTPLRAAAFYNLGNSFFKVEKFGEAVEAYKRALGLDPQDVRAKWNLELALKKKKQQDEKKKQEQDKSKQNQNQEQKDQQQDPKSQEPDKQEPDQQEPDQQDKQDQTQKDDRKPGEQNEQEAAKPDKAPDMRELEGILNGLERSPKDLERELARLRAIRRAPPVKDW